ncbi:MAG TPA: hypothetical protein GXX75_13685 [Clostridiales bacterium]|nr:hypothetical protein [Clostridiales bacterium]
MEHVPGDKALVLWEVVVDRFRMGKSLPVHSHHTGDDDGGHGDAHADAMDRSTDPVHNFYSPLVLTPSYDGLG